MLLFSLRNSRELEFFGVATGGLVGLQALLEIQTTIFNILSLEIVSSKFQMNSQMSI